MRFPPTPGLGELPRIALSAPDGAHADIYLHGAQVTSWTPAGAADDRLFLSSRAKFAANAAIRGGIPVSFPQFASQGPLPNHGFARVSTWDVVAADVAADGNAFAILRLTASAASLRLWPHRFALELEVRVADATLSVALTIANSGTESVEFTAALHTYLRVTDLAATTVHGLAGARYRDKVQGRDDCLEEAACLRIEGPLDRVYRAAPDLCVRESGRELRVRATGFPDTVVWNPGAAGAAAMADLGAGDEARMLCVEAAAAATPVVLAAGGTWRGSQVLTAR